MDRKEIIKRRLLRDGFSIINEYDDPPNELFPDHSHTGDQLLVVMSGEITVTMDGKILILKAGDEMFFPKHIIHSAKIGAGGCHYLDGEKP